MGGRAFFCRQNASDYRDVLSEVGFIDNPVGPHRGHDLFFGENATWIFNENEQSFHSFPGHVDRFPVPEQNLSDGVQFPRSEGEDDSLLQTTRILSLILPVKV